MIHIALFIRAICCISCLIYNGRHKVAFLTDFGKVKRTPAFDTLLPDQSLKHSRQMDSESLTFKFSQEDYLHFAVIRPFRDKG